MKNYCVVVADGARARFFTLDDAGVPEMDSGPKLHECEDRINSEIKVPGRDKWAEAKTGRNIAGIGGSVHGYDDHREQHEDEYLRRFANDITENAVRIAQESQARHLVLVANSRLLGFMRDELDVPSKANFEVKDLVKDLTRFSPDEIQERLGLAGLLPKQKRAGI